MCCSGVRGDVLFRATRVCQGHEGMSGVRGDVRGTRGRVVPGYKGMVGVTVLHQAMSGV